MQVSLKCEIDGDPTSHATWFKDEIPSSLSSSPSFASSLSSSLLLPSRSSLESSDEEEEDDGEEGIKSKLLNRNEDERINNNLKGGKKTIPIALPSPGGIYTIESAKVSDTGWYRCSVDYEFGSFSSYSYYLHIRCKLYSQYFSYYFCQLFVSFFLFLILSLPSFLFSITL